MLVLWAIRFFAFNLYESPKFLMGKGRDEQAVATVHQVAKYNGKTSSLSAEDLRRVEKENDEKFDENTVMHVPAGEVVLRHLSKFDGNHIKPLFATRRIATSTTLLVVLWGEPILSPSWPALTNTTSQL